MSIKDTLKKAKESVYKTFAKAKKTVEDTVDNNKGTIDNIAETLNHGVKKTSDFMKKADKAIENTVISIGDAYDDISSKVSNAYHDFKDKFYTDGDYDSEKTEEYLKTEAKAVLKFGEKAGKKLYELAKEGVNKGAAALKEDYHNIIPEKKDTEGDGKYAGIGTKYKGLLIRQNYEDCLEYHEEVADMLHANTKYKDEILADIKASASKNVDELKKFYMTTGIDGEGVLEKLNTVKKYLE